MNRKRICRLCKKEAVEAIAGSTEVFFKYGVWNAYEKRPTYDVVEKILASGYGADVDVDGETGEYYVCTPTDSDMW